MLDSECAQQQKRGDWARTCEFLTEKRFDISIKRRLWIDAICIDQEDTSERNAQVAIMSRIYSSAKRVIVWLGIEDRFTKLAIETMTLMNSTPMNDWKDWTWTASAYIDYSQTVYNPKIDKWIKETLPGFKALMALIDRSWFKRVWVIRKRHVLRAKYPDVVDL